VSEKQIKQNGSRPSCSLKIRQRRRRRRGEKLRRNMAAILVFYFFFRSVINIY